MAPFLTRLGRAALCAAAFLLAGHAAAQQSKRPLKHSDYDAWRAIQGQQIAPDGRHVAYVVQPQEGDGELVVRNLETGKEWRHPRGARPMIPTMLPKSSMKKGPAPEPRGGRVQFTADSRFLVFPISPSRAEGGKFSKGGKGGRDSVGVMDFASGKVTVLQSVRSFAVPDDGPAVLACLRDAAPAKDSDAKGKKGGELLLRRLDGGDERLLLDVTEFTLSKDGRTLVYGTPGGLWVVDPRRTTTPQRVLSGDGRASRFAWDEKQQRLAFLVEAPQSGKGPKHFIHVWERNGNGSVAKPVELRDGMKLADGAPLTFSRDGKLLFFGVAQEARPAAAEKVVVELWHWKDDFIPPMQKARYNRENARTFRAVVHLDSGQVTQLADATMAELAAAPAGSWAIGEDDRPYRTRVGFDAVYSDHYFVDLTTGHRRPLLKKHSGGISWSAGGKYALFFAEKHWHCVAAPEGKPVTLTANLRDSFAVEDFDAPSAPPPYGVAGWGKDDAHVYLYDRHDVWQVSADGRSANNLTGGFGRKNNLQFRLVSADQRQRTVDSTKPLLLRAEDLKTRDTGYYRLNPGSAPEKLVMAAKAFGPPVKARDADVHLFTASTFRDFPDLHVAWDGFRQIKKISDANPQQKNFLWGDSELVHFKSLDGTALQGMLIKPENFDPKKKYPMIVYIYEKLSQGLHNHVPPRPGTSINFTYYASNGYVVFLPDIAYKVGYPGQSALKCVLSGVQAVVDRGFIDEKAIGIQGHSWGGYQIAYMLTQTDRFKAAAAGAPVANMISAYGGIRWGTGLPRQFQYERTQSRIGGSLWDFPMRFVENSPVFMADRVKTPLLMLHNDNDDAVPWQQGIEYFLALRRLGKEVYLFNYPGEAHGLRKRSNQKDYTVRMQEFFDHHLRGAPMPSWMDRGIPYRPRGPEKKSDPSEEPGE